MVVINQDSPDIEENLEAVAAENDSSDSENSAKVELKTEENAPPTELERLKVFTQRVAKCAAKSFCETYVRPLVIKNPNPLPKCATVDITNQKLDQRAISLTPEQKTDDQGAFIGKPKENEQISPLSNLRQEKQEDNERQAAVVNPNNNDTVAKFIKEEDIITVDRKKPSLSIDIASILSYLPCQSLVAVSEETQENHDVSGNSSSPSQESGPCGANCKCSKSSIQGEPTELGNEEDQ